jgi:hypothetical protein
LIEGKKNPLLSSHFLAPAVFLQELSRAVNALIENLPVLSAFIPARRSSI